MAEEETLRQRLEAAADGEYRQFMKTLLPGVDHLIGVRMPVLRDMTKRALRDGSWRAWPYPGEDASYEEVMMYGLAVCQCREGTSEKLKRLAGFVPRIDNWGVCDSCSSSCRFMKKNREEVFPFLAGLIGSEREFDVRFALVCLSNHFAGEAEWSERILEQAARTAHEGYYAKMALAWLLAELAERDPQRVMTFLTSRAEDGFTEDKAVRKIIESNKIDPDIKQKFREWNRFRKKAEDAAYENSDYQTR